MELTPCQSTALAQMQKPGHYFVTGEAGTGKSFLIHRYLLRYAPQATLLASTGAAAVLIGGRTFHSFFGLGILEGGRVRTVQKATQNGRLIKRLRQCREIVIDEISMLPGLVLQTAEEIARMARMSDEPWGGLKIVAVGDFAQLPPVDRQGRGRDWAFRHSIWDKTDFEVLCLKTPVRFVDKDFYRVLNSIRLGEVRPEMLSILDGRVNTQAPQDITHLYPRRHKVQAFNSERLGELKTSLVEIPSIYSGQPRAIESLKKQAPVPEVLRLKEKAFVMLQQNDPRGRWVNGSTGWVRDIGKEKLQIELSNGKLISLMKSSFSQLDADGNTLAEVVNFPLQLAYATTIHKSQGQTYERARIDLEGLWEPGQAYVALSRLRSLDGLFLTGWTRDSFRVDPQVSEFYSTFQ